MLYDPKWEVEAKLEPWRGLLLEAADLIEQNGWVQFKAQSEDGYCAAGAMQEAFCNRHGYPPSYHPDGRDEYRKASDELAGTIVPHSIPAWNDSLGRSKEEVVAKIREVAFL